MIREDGSGEGGLPGGGWALSAQLHVCAGLHNGGILLPMLLCASSLRIMDNKTLFIMI